MSYSQYDVQEEARLVATGDAKEKLRADVAKQLTEMAGLDPDNPSTYNADKVMNPDEMLRFSQLDMTHKVLKREVDEINASLDSLRKLKPVDEATAKKVEETDTLGRWMQRGADGLTSEERIEQQDLINQFGGGTGKGRKFAIPMRAIFTPAGNPNVIDETTTQSVIRALHSYGGAIQAFSVIHTPDGTKIEYPVYDDVYDSSHSVAADRGKPKRAQTTAGADLNARQTQAQAENKVEPFAVRDIEAFPRNTGFVDVSRFLQEDVKWNVGHFISGLLMERMGRSVERDLTRGDGTTLQPTGLETRAGSVDTTANTNTLDWRDLVKLIHSIEAGYIKPMNGLWGFPQAVPGKVGFMTSWAFLGTIKQLQDTQNRPLVIPSIQDGGMDTLLGYPVFINYELTDQAIAGAGDKPIYFGNFGQMVARFAGATFMIEEHYDSATAIDNTNQYLGRIRYDSECIGALNGTRSEAFKALSRKT